MSVTAPAVTQMFARTLFNLNFIRQPQFFGHPAHRVCHAYLLAGIIHKLVVATHGCYFWQMIAIHLPCFALFEFVISIQNRFGTVGQMHGNLIFAFCALRHAPVQTHVRKQMDM